MTLTGLQQGLVSDLIVYICIISDKFDNRQHLTKPKFLKNKDWGNIKNNCYNKNRPNKQKYKGK